MEPFPFKVQPKTKTRKFLPLLAGVVLGVPLLVMALTLLFTKTDPGKHKVVTQISLIAPPPPPPKPPEVKPPDPPKMKEEVKLDEPKPADQPKAAPEQPPAGPLGLDSAGTGPGDGFGLAGRPGGRDIVMGTGGGGLGTSLFGSSTARHIAQQLARDPKLKGTPYRIEVRIWLSKDGRFEREEIVKGTGDRELDVLIGNALRQVSALQQPLPPNVRQPLLIRVTSSDA